jgi:3-oxoadipate enol-lactonase
VSNSGHVPVNGAQLYYDMTGSGPPLLLIHAGVADSDMWHSQVDMLAPHFQVIRFDMRGFGRSPLPSGSFRNCDDVAGLLDALEIKRAHLIGCSFGALVAVDFALTYPERVDRLVLVAPSIGGMAPPDELRAFWDEEDALLEAGRLTEATELNLALWVDGPYRTPDAVDPEVRAEVGRMQMRAFQLDEPEDAEAIPLDPPAAARLEQLTMPSLVLTGALDRPEKLHLAAMLARDLPHGESIIIDNAAHMLNMEQPEPFNRAVLAFLQAP